MTLPDDPVGIAARIPCPLQAAACARPGGDALDAPEGPVTWAALEARVEATCRRLRALGFREGETLGFVLRPSIDMVVLLLACVRAGIVACPLNLRLPPEGLARAAGRAGCCAVVAEGEAASAPFAMPVLGPSEMAAGEGTAGDRGPVWLRASQPALVLFTSGSTGTPKPALLSVGNLLYSAGGSNLNLPLAPGDRWLLSLPLYHVGGLGILFRCLLAGATVVLPAPGVPVEEALEARAVTHASLVSTQLVRLLQRDPSGVSQGLKAILLGGSAMPEALLREAVARGLPVHTSYGLTEMGSQVTTTPPGASAEALRGSGRVLPYREIRVSPEGELLVRGPTLFLGYVTPDGLDPARDADGWYHTGDLGHLDPDGSLTVSGRRDNLFISGGENVQPEEIEALLYQVPGIRRAVVVPVPDDLFGFRPVAFIQTEEGTGASPSLQAGARAHLERLLPRYKVPVAFHPWPTDAPEGMKVDRRFFRRRAAVLPR